MPLKRLLITSVLIVSAWGVVSAATASSTCVTLTKNLSRGSSGSEVLMLQQFLFDTGYLKLKPSGTFGSLTLNAVKGFQSTYNISSVGSVGMLTRLKIKDVSCRNVGITQIAKESIQVATTTFSCGDSTVKDVDGNVYDTVSVGSQCWMKQNMRVGKRINVSTPQSNNKVIEKYCYSDKDSNCTDAHPNQPDGGLYQWDEAMQYSTKSGSQGICPKGWHIPTHDQFTTLERAVCTSNSCINDFTYDTKHNQEYRGTNEGTKLKPNGTSGMEVNLAGTSLYTYSFMFRGSEGVLWSSTDERDVNAWYRSVYMSTNGSEQMTRGTYNKGTGLSVRCLKD
jgi:uncharacterized protein (TIGR02145 family)